MPSHWAGLSATAYVGVEDIRFFGLLCGRGCHALRVTCQGSWDASRVLAKILPAVLPEYLREVLDEELHSREQRVAATRVREARFPDVKTLDQIDWDARSSVSRPKIAELATCGFIDRAEDVIIAGPVGTGKRRPRATP